MATSNKDIISNTLANNMKRHIEEYKAIKAKTSAKFKTVKEFCQYYGFSHQNFMKILHRYEANPVPESLVPQKRGPKYKTRRIDLSAEIEDKIKALRAQGTNRYEIAAIIKNTYKDVDISATTIYRRLKEYGLNKLTESDRAERRSIIKTKIGELVHIDCCQLSKGIVEGSNKPYFLLGVIDDYSRLCWVEVLEDKTALTVMFGTMKAFIALKTRYGVDIEAAMTDNGAEFGSGRKAKNKNTHPFEALLQEMQIRHFYTRPYKPQTNGKIERFWKLLREDFVNGSCFKDLMQLKDELLGYLIYYNEYRGHTALNGQTPMVFSKQNAAN